MSLEKLGLDEVKADPNHTAQSHPHTDIIREKLKERAADPKLPTISGGKREK